MNMIDTEMGMIIKYEAVKEYSDPEGEILRSLEFDAPGITFNISVNEKDDIVKFLRALENRVESFTCCISGYQVGFDPLVWRSGNNRPFHEISFTDNADKMLTSIKLEEIDIANFKKLLAYIVESWDD